ncbi:hypothetical protein HB770_04000 [Rhizobium leguminosarum bv. viciae]|uniref:Uncharacterized protein n=1 Tax=Rhizobium leguminosarum bv. viciae TaxID=387 RepID=A0A7G6RHS7_RHILV|nr:hypothetical protein HB770_04000 [Rhizobium leguminosarum bv. viciae]
MNMPFNRRRPFADLEQVSEAAAPIQKRPAAEPPTRTVTFKRREDGTVYERSARPAFMFRDPKSPAGNIVLPEGYYWRDSTEHTARRRELGLD